MDGLEIERETKGDRANNFRFVKEAIICFMIAGRQRGNLGELWSQSKDMVPEDLFDISLTIV